MTGLSLGLRDRFQAVRRTTERLCDGLTAEDCQVQSMDDASPIKWHLAHTTWFFETFVLMPRGAAPFDSAFQELFNSYYVSVGPRHPRPKRGSLSRPPLSTVWEYRRYVEDRMLLLLDQLHDQESRALTELGLHHEQQHQELILTDLKHHFGTQPLRPIYRPARDFALSVAPPLSFVDFDAGLRSIGHAGEDFAFDNELERHRVWLESFSIATRLVTEGEFLAFIHDGGYRRPELWLSDGWDCVVRHGWTAPLYWSDAGGDWRVYTLAGERTLRAESPVVHVSYYEADAYARWVGSRLPTEMEWECLATGKELNADSSWGAMLDDGCFHPRPSGAPGVTQVFGDCWEWTASAYLPFPGYQPARGAVGEYNGKFMSGQMVLRGGSCVTPRDHLRPTYRNFFPPSARWQFSGIRLAR